MVKKVSSYKASDGKEFHTEAEAAAHEEILAAEAAYEKARIEYCSFLAKQARTKDGHPFDWGVWHYYRVDVWGRVHDVSTLRNKIELDDYDKPVLFSIDCDMKAASFQIEDLYRFRRNAETEAAKILRERAADLIEQAKTFEDNSM